MRPYIHLLLTELWSTGGMQQYNRQLLSVLHDVVRPHGGTVSAFTLNDGETRKGVRGFSRRLERFSLAVEVDMVRRQPDVLLLGHISLTPIAPSYRILSPRTRIYLVAHGIEVESRLHPAFSAGLRACHGVLCVSEATRRVMVERRKVPWHKTGLLYYGFTPSCGTGPVSGPSQMNRPLLLAVSRLDPGNAYKGIDRTLAALPLVCERFPQLHYVVVGDGPDAPRLRRLAAELGVTASVTFAGRVPDDELDALYQACDIFILPSTHEGLGIVYLEAMARGKPVIGVHAGGVPDAVVHEANGLLVPDQAPDSIAGAIARLAQDPAFCRRLGEFGRDVTVPRFAVSKLEDRVREIIGIGAPPALDTIDLNVIRPSSGGSSRSEKHGRLPHRAHQ